MLYYVNDNVDHFPFYAFLNRTDPVYTSGTGKYWNEVLMQNYIKPRIKIDDANAFGVNNVWKLFTCPGFAAPVYAVSNIHYGYNQWHIGDCGRQGCPGAYDTTRTHNSAKVFQIKKPVRTILVADADKQDLTKPLGSAGSCLAGDARTIVNSKVHARHNMAANILRVDGHVDSPKALSSSVFSIYDDVLGQYTSLDNQWTRSGKNVVP